MKITLLKELRKEFKWGCKDGKWYLYTPYDRIKSYTNSECIVLSMIHHKIIYSKSWFDLPWSKIYDDYRNKFELREFKNKIK